MRAAREVAANKNGDPEERRSAFSALFDIKDPELPPILRAMLDETGFRGEAIRALAAYNDPLSAVGLLRVYRALSPNEQRDALMTLAARPDSANQLLAAVSSNRINAKDLSANVVRQFRALNQPDINSQLEKLWGVARETSSDKTAADRRLRGVIEKMQQDANSASVVTPNETVRISHDEIKKQTASEVSMMPEILLNQFNNDEIRDLIAYVRSR